VVDGRLFAMATDDYWLDAGNPELYLQANLDLLRGTRHDLSSIGVHDEADVDSSAAVTGSIVSAGATVGAGATITDSVLLPGAVVEEHAMVANSVVMGRIGHGANVQHCVLGLHGAVLPGEELSGQSRPPVDST
jgi:ADP-glucose pyrophosphorylase